MNDFETVRTYAGSDLRAHDALDRIEAEVETLQAENGRIMNTFQKAQAENRAEVERLRDGPMARVNAELRAENERLRAAHECCWHDGHGHGALGPCAVTEREARAALAKEEA